MTALLIDSSITSPGQGESQGRDPTSCRGVLLLVSQPLQMASLHLQDGLRFHSILPFSKFEDQF